MSARDYLPPRDELLDTIERIYGYRMTTTSGGNLSIRDETGGIWITPARIDKGSLRRTDMVRVAPDGAVEGLHKPSSEFPFHEAIYKVRPDLHGIVHAHPVALVAFSIVGQVPNTLLFHQARHVCGEIGFAPYALPGGKDLAANIARTFAQGYSCVVLENHGVVTGGATLQQAFQRFETLEFVAKTIVKAAQLGPVRYLTEEQAQQPRERIEPLPQGPARPIGTPEKELRRTLCEFVRRGYRQRLLISTEGSFSARLGDDSFLITPYQVDRRTVDLDDLVLVTDGLREPGKMPSRAARNHRAIYRRHPEVKAIVNAYTVNATAFSVTGAPFDARTIPESYIFLRDAVRVPFGTQFGRAEELAEMVAPDRPIAIQDNDGVLVLGTGILDAFDRLEVLESTAEAIINSKHMGEIRPISEAQVIELRRAFLGLS